MSLYILRKLILYLLLGSLGGLLFCRLIDSLCFRHGKHLDQTTIGFWILCVLEMVFGLAALILVLLQVILRRSEVKMVRERWGEGHIDPEGFPPFWKHLFYTNYADVPKWVYLPFVIVAAVLASFLGLFLVVLVVLGLLWVLLHMLEFIFHLFGH